MNKSLALIGLLAFTFLGQVATAAGEGRPVASPDGRQTTVARTAEPARIAPPMPKEDAMLSVLYDNFNADPNNLYSCCVGWTVAGRKSQSGPSVAMANPFTPASDATVRKIVVAVGYLSGVNGVQVSLNADDGGLPGAVIRKFDVSSLPAYDTCCATSTVSLGVPVTAGTPYWVVVRTNKKTADTLDAWNWNNTGPIDEPYAYSENNGPWTLGAGILGAFKVLGKE